MLKPFMGASALILILISGLVSCSADKKRRDVYDAPPPTLRRNSEIVALRDFEARVERTADLQDVLDFHAASPARIKVKAQCRAGEKTYSSGFSFAGVLELAVFQILPEEVLLVDLNGENVDCGLELALFNDVGSTHIFNLMSLRVRNEGAATVDVAHEVHVDASLKMTLPDMEDVRVRSSIQEPMIAQVACVDMTLPPLPFTQVLDLARFAFNQWNLRPDREPEVLQKFPVQTCKVLLLRNGIRAGISAAFQVILPPPSLPAQKIFEAPQCGRDLSCPWQAQMASNGNEFILETWRINNSSATARTLRFPKTLYRLEYDSIGASPVGTKDSGLVTSEGRMLILRPRSEAAVLSDDRGQTTLRLNPGQSVTVDLLLPRHVGYLCPRSRAFSIRLLEPLPILNIAEDGEVSETMTLAHKREFRFHDMTDSTLNYYPHLRDTVECRFP
jgi:hypothetical protein